MKNKTTKKRREADGVSLSSLKPEDFAPVSPAKMGKSLRGAVVKPKTKARK